MTVLIADNQALTNKGISSILSHYLTSIYIECIKNKEELLSRLERSPRVLIIDMDFFDSITIHELSEIREIAPCMDILVITDNHSKEDTLAILDCGITHYITKSCEEHELTDAFNAILAKRKYLSNSIIDKLIERKNQKQKIQNLPVHITPSEQEIIRLITQGLTTKDIARRKKLSYHTVITHRKNIFRKMDISNVSELIMYAMRNGMADMTEYYI